MRDNTKKTVEINNEKKGNKKFEGSRWKSSEMSTK